MKGTETNQEVREEDKNKALKNSDTKHIPHFPPTAGFSGGSPEAHLSPRRGGNLILNLVQNFDYYLQLDIEVSELRLLDLCW